MACGNPVFYYKSIAKLAWLEIRSNPFVFNGAAQNIHHRSSRKRRFRVILPRWNLARHRLDARITRSLGPWRLENATFPVASGVVVGNEIRWEACDEAGDMRHPGCDNLDRTISCAPGAAPVLAAGAPVLTITIQGTAPRQVEDTTQRAVPRDYSAAWQSLAEALDENRADLLAANFVGQRRTNCATRSVSNKRRDCVSGSSTRGTPFKPCSIRLKVRRWSCVMPRIFKSSYSMAISDPFRGRQLSLCSLGHRGRKFMEGADPTGCPCLLTFPVPLRLTSSGVYTVSSGHRSGSGRNFSRPAQLTARIEETRLCGAASNRCLSGLVSE